MKNKTVEKKKKGIWLEFENFQNPIFVKELFTNGVSSSSAIHEGVPHPLQTGKYE